VHSAFPLFFGLDLHSRRFFLGIFEGRFLDFDFFDAFVAAVLFRMIILNELVALIDSLELLLSLRAEGVPLPDYFGYDFGLPHFRVLVLVLVVLLTRELAVDLMHGICLFLLPH
jgi:hypothetical protein